MTLTLSIQKNLIKFIDNKLMIKKFDLSQYEPILNTYRNTLAKLLNIFLA